MKYIIDRFEGEYAVCEDEAGNMHDLPLAKLPKGAKEGDVIVEVDDAYIIDHEETEQRKKKIQSLMDELFK